MFVFLISVLYLAFVGLGLPDSVLGSAWPSMFGELGVPLSEITKDGGESFVAGGCCHE